MASCTLFFFVKAVPTKLPAAQPPAMKPMIHVVWRMGWDDGKTGTPRHANVDIKSYGTVSGGFFGSEVKYEVFKLNPLVVKSDADAQGVLKDPTFTWAKDAITVSLHSVSVELTSTELPAGDDPFYCVISP